MMNLSLMSTRPNWLMASSVFLFFFLPPDWARPQPSRRLRSAPSARCQVTVYLDVAATVAVMRAHADSYVTVLAPLLARWLKRRRNEHGKTCERCEDFSERQLFHVLWFSFWPPCMHKPQRCAFKRDYKGNVTAVLQFTVLFCCCFFFLFLCVCVLIWINSS